MKRLNSLFTVAMLAVSMVVVSLAATSCSNDDDDNNGGGESSTNIIVGTWSGLDDWGDRMTLTFKKDGTGTYNMIVESDTDNGTFSYEMLDKSTGMITVKYYDSFSGAAIERYGFRIEGTKMYVNDYDDEDFQWILTKK